MKLSEKVVSKLLSGRFWLTIIAGLVFAYASVKGILSAEAIASILSAVFISYFQKKEDNNGHNGVA